MARSVVWTELAWADLQQAVEHIARDSPTYAAAFARRVWEQAQSLDELAYRGRVVPELGDPQVRELFPSSHRLLYEIRDEAIYVLGLIHGARDLMAIWDREGDERRDSTTPPSH